MSHRMTRGRFVLFASSLALLSAAFSHLAASAQAPQSAGPAVLSSPPQRALVDKYCVTCHNQRAKTAGLMLDTLDISDTASLPAHAEVWEKVIRKVRGGLMPPVGIPRPDRAALNALAAYLETSIDK